MQNGNFVLELPAWLAERILFEKTKWGLFVSVRKVSIAKKGSYYGLFVSRVVSNL